jgi:hypothetical protein
MENNKKVAIILSILSVASIGFYFWKKNRDNKKDISNKNPLEPKIPYQMDKKFIEDKNTKSSFDNEFTNLKCSCTGKKIDKNSDIEILDKFKNSCLKNGGSLIEIK